MARFSSMFMSNQRALHAILARVFAATLGTAVIRKADRRLLPICGLVCDTDPPNVPEVIMLPPMLTPATLTPLPREMYKPSPAGLETKPL